MMGKAQIFIEPLQAPRRFGLCNVHGTWTLMEREVRRFLNVYVQTLIAPMITSLLFLGIFSLALGRAVETVHGVSFQTFIAPGLVVMALAQNAFANTSSSLVVSKIQGNIVDVLLPPLSAAEFVLAFNMGAVLRGVMVGVLVSLSCAVFVPFPVVHPLYAVAFGVLGSLLLGVLGFIGGLWSEKFDHIAAVTNFVVTPLTFLSGTFYSIHRLPEPFFSVVWFNPFFYMIDGFRYGILGVSDSDPNMGLLILLVVNIVLLWWAWYLVRTGYRLKH